MSNASRLAGRKKEKVRAVRTKKLKVDMTKLPEAIVNGELVVKVKGRVVFERHANKRVELHRGIVWSVDSDLVTVWDETREQYYTFSLKQTLPVMKAESADDLVLLQKAPASIIVDEEPSVGSASQDPRTDPDELAPSVESAAAGVSEPDGC